MTNVQLSILLNGSTVLILCQAFCKKVSFQTYKPTNLQNCYTTANKNTYKDDIIGLGLYC
jgi:hypothetical protein